MIYVLVTGSRDWADHDRMNEAFYQFAKDHEKVDFFVHGDARGADRLAAQMAETYWPAAEIVAFPAEWHKHGKAAGPVRNQQMVTWIVTNREPEDEVYVLAFPRPESRGTADCMSRAVRAGFPVTVIQGD